MVAYGMVPEDLEVWLEPVDPARIDEHRSGLLCRRHADAMVVPVGWVLDDRREPVPRLFRPPAATPSLPRDATGGLRRPRRAEVDTPELFDPAVTASDGAATASADESAPPPADGERDATAWMPQFDPDDDLGGLLDAESPLLARAFRGRPRPTSADHSDR